MASNPAAGSGRFSGWHTRMSNPERELSEVVGALRDSSQGLEKAAELVDDRAVGAALVEMSEMRRTAADTVVALAADAGVVIDRAPDGSFAGALRRGWMSLEANIDGDRQIIDTVISQEDALVGSVDEALGSSIPQAVKDQLRLTAIQVRDGVQLLSNWG
jgi:hypothetical protein